jgi:membrane-associated protease RseP (regulator of RpoE activity)
MNWLAVVILFILVYGICAAYIYKKKLFGDHVAFYGPILAIRSKRVGFLDAFTPLATFLRLYATFGVIMVVVISVLITLMLFLSLQYTLIVQPPPTGIYEPQNILLLPGINDYIPSTFAVWFAFVLTIAVHELGHGILSRVEGIRVRAIGALIAVIPIGFFVEPDESELEQAKPVPKVRMFGAGITNNIVLGVICFTGMILLFGVAVPTDGPVIQGVYENYSATQAGVPPWSLITGIDGIAVSTRDQVSAYLDTTVPGQNITLQVEKDSVTSSYDLTLSSWPPQTVNRTTGFMGVYYYNGPLVSEVVADSLSPIGFLRLITVPFDTSAAGQSLRVLAVETPATEFYTVPGAWFWGAIHLLFWAGWININVGIFNAIPLVPLDGGYIMKEGVDRLFSRRGLSRYAPMVVSFISTIMIVMLISLILLPYLLNA